MTIPIIIPAYQPDGKLVELVESLVNLGFESIVVVNDGGGNEYEVIFQQIVQYKQVTLLKHAVNLGKGRALKTAFNFILNNFSDIPGVVTADSDGQHLPNDIYNVANVLAKNSNCLVLGARKFNTDVPFRSRFGNSITKFVFRIIVGEKLSDTQTGLRGIPISYIPICLTLDGERYEYEINMLIFSRKLEIKIIEQSIQTKYIEGNKSSHFNPFFDSLRIYFVLLRFTFSSMLTSIIDFLVFLVCYSYGLQLVYSTIIARLVAGNFNFIVNKKLVFKDEGSILKEGIKYWVLVGLLGTISYFSIQYLRSHQIMNVVPAKIFIEAALFIASFAIQRDLIFNSSKK